MSIASGGACPFRRLGTEKACRESELFRRSSCFASRREVRLRDKRRATISFFPIEQRQRNGPRSSTALVVCCVGGGFSAIPAEARYCEKSIAYTIQRLMILAVWRGRNTKTCKSNSVAGANEATTLAA